MTEEPMHRHVLVLGGTAESLVNFRGPLIRTLVARGHRVTAAAGTGDIGAAGLDDAAVMKTLAEWRVGFRPLPLGRTGLNPLADLAALGALVRLFRREKPDVLLAYTIKPVVYGVLAARLAGVKRRIAMITGLGYAFTDGAERRRWLVRVLATAGYRVALRGADRVIFQNPDDRCFFLDHAIVRPERAALVAGSGVDLAYYAPRPLPDGPPTFLLIARLIADKGIREYVEAARIVRRALPEARFMLAGPLDSNPAAISAEELAAWQREGIVDYCGVLTDVRPALAACHVYVLPSYYGEGIPRTVLEAMATGRAIVTTDAPGCRETVAPGTNGFLVPPRDTDALAAALLRLVRNPTLVAETGAASLEYARERFDVAKVNATVIEIVEGETSATKK